MNKETLDKANELARKIREYDEALNCFEYDLYYYAREDNPNLPEKMGSTNPQLIIEHDDVEEGCGRTITRIPIVLSDTIIKMIKKALKEGRTKLQDEFNGL